MFCPLRAPIEHKANLSVYYELIFTSLIMETVISDGILPLHPHFRPHRTSRLSDVSAVSGSGPEKSELKEKSPEAGLASAADELFMCGLVSLPARAESATEKKKG